MFYNFILIEQSKKNKKGYFTVKKNKNLFNTFLPIF
jgi:hypothetical protein